MLSATPQHIFTYYKNCMLAIFLHCFRNISSSRSINKDVMYCCLAPESAPRMLQYENITSSSIRLTWEPPLLANGKMKFFTIYYHSTSINAGLKIDLFSSLYKIVGCHKN